MINEDVVIKLVRATLGCSTGWVSSVRYILSRLEEVKLGFPGIRNDHLSLVRGCDISEGDLFIYDEYLLPTLTPSDDFDIAPVMYRQGAQLDSGIEYTVEGIGMALDLLDLSRCNTRWQDKVIYPPLPSDCWVLRVDCRPTSNGGPGYYYFYRSYRDLRL